MQQHKHAEVLRAIANGVSMDEFEIIRVGRHGYEPLKNCGSWISTPDDWEISRKPQHIMVNGFKVPKPLDALVFGQAYFLPMVVDAEWGYQGRFNTNTELGKRHCKQRVAHATVESAIAHAKAMLGIDPEFETN